MYELLFFNSHTSSYQLNQTHRAASQSATTQVTTTLVGKALTRIIPASLLCPTTWSISSITTRGENIRYASANQQEWQRVKLNGKNLQMKTCFLCCEVKKKPPQFSKCNNINKNKKLKSSILSGKYLVLNWDVKQLQCFYLLVLWVLSQCGDSLRQKLWIYSSWRHFTQLVDLILSLWAQRFRLYLLASWGLY